MKKLFRFIYCFVLFLSVGYAGCTQHLDAPSLPVGTDPDVLSVAFTSSLEEEYFAPGATREFGMRITGAVDMEIHPLQGWSATYVESLLSVTAPERGVVDFIRQGDIVVTVTNAAGESRTATLRVCYTEELTLSFATHDKQVVELGESKTVSFVSTGATRFTTAVPRGWRAEVEGSDLTIWAPDFMAVDYAVSGTVTLKAFADGETVEDSLEVEVSVGGTDLNVDGRTSNCYLVSSGGRYHFKATVMGNGSIGLSDGLKAKLNSHGYSISSTELPKASRAFLLWETTKGSISNVQLSGDGSSVSFVASQSDAVRTGNAVIAVADDSGGILWSWHLWLTDKPREQMYQSGHVLMDRNLGACSAEPAKLESLGLLYQWGRKDPFPGGDAVNAGNGQLYEAFVTDHTLPTYNAEGYGFKAIRADLTTGSMDYVISHPWIFVHAVILGSGDWYQGESAMFSERNEYLWGNPKGYMLSGSGFTKGQKSIYDPCPPGYRVPDADTFVGFCKNGSAGGTNMHIIHGTVDDYRMPTDAYGTPSIAMFIGLNFIYDAAGNYSWFPAAGQRVSETGCTQSVGANMFQWTNSPYNESTLEDAFYLWAATKHMYPMKDGGRHAYGLSVRCQKE